MSDNNIQGSQPAWPWANLPAYRADYCARNPVPDPGSVVAELASRKQWLVWGYRPGETEDKKYRKMPHYADGGRRFGNQGDEADRRRLVTLAAAVDAVSKGDFDGVGFAFLPNDGLIGIDLDGMIDPASGEVSERCQSIIDACASYTEVSPSGKGVHIFCALEHSEETRSFKSNKIGVECFIGAQFFTFTGRVWPGSSGEVNPLAEPTYRRLKATVESARSVSPTAEPQSIPEAPPALPGKAGGKQRSLAESVALAEEALGSLSPDDYELWIEIGLACMAGLGSAGYLVWDAWSSSSEKYAGSADTARRWKSFKPSKITLGTLFSRAEAAGWESPWAKAEKRKQSRKPNPAPPPYDWGATSQSPAAEKHFDASTAAAREGETLPGGADVPPPRMPEPPDDDDWECYLVRKSGAVTKCLANAVLYLEKIDAWKGVIAYDEFAERTVFRRPLPFDPSGPAYGEWTDHLEAKTAVWMQRTFRVEFSTLTVGQAVEVVARGNRFNPVRDALEGLPPWDGIRRNADWLSDYLGVAKTEYTTLVGQFFLIGMVKRIFEPGCKFDYSLVLEGDQGLGKSTAVRILAWNWFADTDLDLSSKDALLALPGHWVYEISEMGSLAKAEASKQKSFLSRQEDEYRPPYGKRLIKAPRQLVFVGTTNEEEYLKDPTGGRRFWPVMCGGEFNLDGLRENILRMYAEALHDYREQRRCWPSKDEQKALFTPEQAKRGMQEPFDDLLFQWVKTQGVPFSMAEAATDGLKLTADKLSPAVVTRIGIALRKMGCGRQEHRQAADKGDRRLYVPPSLMKSSFASGYVAVEGSHDVGF